MPVSVVDSSLLSAWAFREPRAREAYRVIRSSDLHAPALLGYEMANVARTKARRHPERTTEIFEGLRTALRLAITFHPTDHEAATRLALEEGLSAYDASYLLLARQLGARLLTFDDLLIRAIGDET